MISRERLYKANVKAKKRWQVYHSPKWSGDETLTPGVNCTPWQRYRDTAKPCSCPMCGNPRRHFNEPTLAEKKFVQAHQF